GYYLGNRRMELATQRLCTTNASPAQDRRIDRLRISSPMHSTGRSARRRRQGGARMRIIEAGFARGRDSTSLRSDLPLTPTGYGGRRMAEERSPIRHSAARVRALVP